MITQKNSYIIHTYLTEYYNETLHNNYLANMQKENVLAMNI